MDGAANRVVTRRGGDLSSSVKRNGQRKESGKLADGLLPRHPCAACLNAINLGIQCRICNMFLYCSTACAENDAKKHKKTCAKLVLAEKSGNHAGLMPEEERMFLGHQIHAMLLEETKKQRAESERISADIIAIVPSKATLEREMALAKEEAEKARAEAERRKFALLAAFKDVQSAQETMEAFPFDVRHEKMPVIGCGNSELSEKMCCYGFRDVPSVNTSESAMGQTAEREWKRNFPADTTCRYLVMDACELRFESGRFSGVVDKGALDAVIGGGGDAARRMCSEAMRVLKTGGKFLVISNAPTGILREALVDVCGPDATCDAPLPVPIGNNTDVVYAYTVAKDAEGRSLVGKTRWEPEDCEDDEDGEWSETGPGSMPPMHAAPWLRYCSPSDLAKGRLRELTPAQARALKTIKEQFGIGHHSELRALTTGDGAQVLSELIESFEAERCCCEATVASLARGEEPSTEQLDSRAGKKSTLAFGDGGTVELIESLEATIYGGARVSRVAHDGAYSSEYLKASDGVRSPGACDSNAIETVLADPRQRVTRNGETFQAESAAQGSDLALGLGDTSGGGDCADTGKRRLSQHTLLGVERTFQTQADEAERTAPAAARVRKLDEAVVAAEGLCGQSLAGSTPWIDSLRLGRDQQRQGKAEEDDTLGTIAAAGRDKHVEILSGAKRMGIERLPWGVHVKEYEEDATYVTMGVGMGSDLKASQLSVEFSLSRVKVLDNGKQLLDAELTGKIVVADSTWSIDDKTVLSLSLCKREKVKWLRGFKIDADVSAVSSKCYTQENPVKEARAPWSALTPVSRARKPSERDVPFTLDRTPTAPKRFLLEQQDGIGLFQLHLSKPLGWEVTQTKIDRCCDPGMIEVRFVCTEAATALGGRASVRYGAEGGKRKERNILKITEFVQRARLGRDDFDEEKAEYSYTTEGGTFVARIHFGSSASSRGGRGLVGGEKGIPETSSDHYGGYDDILDGDVSRVGGLRCRSCGHFITPRGGRGLTVRALPSGRWDDCIEDMICFEGPSAVPMLARDVTFARPGFCLVGHAEALIHVHDLVDGAVAIAVHDVVPGLDAKIVVTDNGEGEGRDDERGSLKLSAGSANERRLQCARCHLSLGRMSTLVDGRRLDKSDGSCANGGCGGEEEVHGDADVRGGETECGAAGVDKSGMLLLKHCLLGDDVSRVTDGVTADFNGLANGSGNKNKNDNDDDGRSSERHSTFEGNGDAIGTSESEIDAALSDSIDGVSGAACADTLPPSLRPVFATVTPVHWLMGEMEHARSVDRHSRFILTVSGRAPVASAGCLGILVLSDHTRVSQDGVYKPHRALRVAFREQTVGLVQQEEQEEEKRQLEAELRGCGGGDGACRPREGGPGGGGGGVQEGLPGARTPARELVLSHSDYEMVREKLFQASWASFWTVDPAYARLDARGYRFSYLF